MSDLSPTNSVRRRIDLILNPEPDTASGQSIRFATNPKILDALESLITEAETKAYNKGVTDYAIAHKQTLEEMRKP